MMRFLIMNGVKKAIKNTLSKKLWDLLKNL